MVFTAKKTVLLLFSKNDLMYGMHQETYLTGVKPTGDIHLGNYFGAISPALSLAKDHPSAKKFFFIADYHALTTIKDTKQMSDYRYHVAAAWLAFFEGVEGCDFYFQSCIPEIFELYWILSCFCPKGLLNRAHAYKALTAQNKEIGHDDDRNINQGVFSYPVLMAADILLFHATKIPIGPDQKQHVEIAIDIVQHLNRQLQVPIPVPEPVIQENTPLILGIDGQKMSKNYQNTIPIFESEAALKKQISKIQTDSKPLGEPLNSNDCMVFQLHQLMASAEATQQMQAEYSSGCIGYGHAKQRLLAAMLDFFSPARARFFELIHQRDQIDALIQSSLSNVQTVATANLRAIKSSLGVSC
ncbi:MAG: tryptophan--tRNA ligase [Candidatus Margulisbacteria bacterium]|nr:tryptophan--tRNA ligase [Candidatus Margulisiibacteriota bacterium]